MARKRYKLTCAPIEDSDQSAQSRVFHANQTSTSELRMRLARRETDLSPPVKYFY